MKNVQTSNRELPIERLASLDETGRRINIQPALVHGLWKSRRVLFQSFLLFIFLVLPWVKINGLQAILIDIPSRRFAIFGLALWAHDTPLLLLILAVFAFTVAFVTVLWGRVWCGWACPQTVFIERVYRAIEIFIEGSHLKRRELDKAPWNQKKLLLRGSKWLAFILVSLILTHSFLAYFVGTERLQQMVQASPTEEWETFVFMITLSGVILFNFGWFREQFCIIMCPYGKIQSLLTDENTLTVTYDTSRGEPRRPGSGDCVNCFKCVQVCPTGIDIRRGSQQLECIGCTACIDACFDVMTKTKKPTGLIRYASDVTIQKRQPSRMFEAALRLKPVFYFSLIVLSLLILFSVVGNRDDLRITALRAIENPYQVIAGTDGEPLVINHFKIDIRNQSAQTYKLKFKTSDLSRVKLITAMAEYNVAAGDSERIDAFFEFSQSSHQIEPKIQLVIDAISNERHYTQTVDLNLLSPAKGRQR